MDIIPIERNNEFKRMETTPILYINAYIFVNNYIDDDSILSQYIYELTEISYRYNYGWYFEQIYFINESERDILDSEFIELVDYLIKHLEDEKRHDEANKIREYKENYL